MSALSAIEAPAMEDSGAEGTALREPRPRGERLKAIGGRDGSSRANSAVDAIDGRQPRSSSIPVASSGSHARPGNVRGESATRLVAAGRISPGLAGADPVLAGSIWAGPVPINAVPINPVPINPVPISPRPTRAASTRPMSATAPAAARPQRTGMSSARAGELPTRLRLTRRGRVVVAALVITGVIVAALLITFLASGGAQATNHDQARAGYKGMHKIVVQPGQTLWSIATTAEPSADPRTVVQEIMTANALSGPGVMAGQLLWVPR